MVPKHTKRDIEHSRQLLLDHDAEYRLNTNGDLFYPDQHLRIDNTNIEPRLVATKIMERFSIPAPRGGRPRC